LRKFRFELFLILSFLILFILKFYSILKISDNIFFTEDTLQIEYWFKLISETNMFGIEHSIANPVGDSIWSNPSLGVAISGSALVLQDILNLGSAQTVLAVFFLVGAANFTSTIYLSKVLNLNRLLTSFLTLAIGLSPYYIEKIGAIGVAAFYPLVIIISYTIKYQSNRHTLVRKDFLILFVVILTASFWWLIVALVIFALITTIYLLISFLNRSFKNSFKFYLATTIYVFFSLFFYFVISLRYSYLRGENRFQAWQNEIFSGKLSNFFLSSPFIDTSYPTLITTLHGGVSPGAILDRVGFISGISTLFLFILILLNFTKVKNPIEHLPWYSPLLLLGLVSTLFYISGGLGNIVSGVFVLLEQVSPIRSWSRLNIIMSIIGLILLSVLVQFKFSKRQQAIFLFCSSLFILLDLYYATLPETNYIDKSDEKSVSDYLFNNVSFCKVLQIPVDTQPIPQDYVNEERGKFYYTNYRQYLLNSNLNWSFGNWTQSDGWVHEASIPTTVNQEWIKSTKENICAIVYDKEYAEWRSRTAVEWPGLIVSLDKPDFVNSRYNVYLVQ